MLQNLFLFRQTSECPSLWLPLSIQKHQRMRNCKECLQRNLPTNIFSMLCRVALSTQMVEQRINSQLILCFTINIFASLVVSKISKQKSYKFVCWKISYTKSSMMAFTQRTLTLGQRPSGQCFPSKSHFNFYVSMKNVFVSGSRNRQDNAIMRPKRPCHFLSVVLAVLVWRIVFVFGPTACQIVSGFAAEKPNMDLYMTYLIKIL